MSVACVVIASAERRGILDALILPSVLTQGFTEVVVVGPYHSGEGYRHLPFSPLFNNPVDALFKRDMGAVATSSDWIMYLCDDHRLDPKFGSDLRTLLGSGDLDEHSIIVPQRYCIRGGRKIGLNMGYPGHQGRAYCGGHGGIYHRSVIRQVPWSSSPWHPNWDVWHSWGLTERGYHLYYDDVLAIEDVDPNPRVEPWE